MPQICRLIAFVLLFPGAAIAAELTFLSLSGRTVDEADLLSPEQETELSQMLELHEQATTNQVVVVTLPSLQGVTIEDYGYQLGRHWGIGREGKDNGVLLIVAPKQRKVRIEVGYGLEGQLTDALAKTIIEAAVLPLFRRDDYAGGIEAGVEGIIDVLTGEYSPPDIAKKTDRRSGGISGWAILLIFLGLISLSALGAYRQDLSDSRRRGHGAGNYPVGYYGRGHHGRGGFRGGFSGGGGGFGGGGASGGW